MPSPITHIYLSPHLDDAVLSCGGTIHRHVKSHARVVVITLCAGEPPKGLLSPLAEELHERWGFGLKDAVAARREEDFAALRALGAEAVHLDVPDAIYRRNPSTNGYLYASTAALFAPLPTVEANVVRRIAHQLKTLLQGFGRQLVYAPLGLGNHVDHQLTREAAEQSARVYAYYEDYPYATGEAGVGTPTSNLVTDKRLTPEVIPLTPANLTAKTKAIAHYTSQLSSFWPDVPTMTAAVEQFAAEVGGERIWRTGLAKAASGQSP